MWHHIVLWPFKKIDSWLKSHYEKKQTQELISIEQKRLLLEIIPDLNVYPRLIPRPDPPRRNDVPIVDVIVCNYGGKTKIVEGRFWITRSDDPAYKQEKHLVDLEMPKGKEENFFFYVKLVPYAQIMSGHAILKFSYDIHFYGPTQQPEHTHKTRQYYPQQDSFIDE
jgi:hypothetical protein